MSRQRIIAFVLAALTLAAALSGCALLPSEDLPIAPPLSTAKPPNYNTKKVELGDFSVILEVSGECQANDAHLYAMPITAQLLEYPISPDNKVKKGDVLCRIDNADLELIYLEAKLAAITARSDYEGATNDEARTRALIALRHAEQARDEALVAFEASTFVSPIDGVIHYRNTALRPGDEVEGGTPMFSIFDPNGMVLNYIDPSDEGVMAKQFRTDDQVIIKVYVDGQLNEIAGVVTRSPHDFANDVNRLPEDERTVVVAIAPEQAHLFTYKQGFYFYKVTEKLESVMLLPRSAVNIYQDRAFVYVKDANGVRVERDVVVGPYNAQHYVILEGMNVGDEVIVSR